MYKIEYDPELDLLDIAWFGLFTPADVERYAKDCRACWERERFTDGYRLRIVLRDGLVLPQATLALLLRAFLDFPKAGHIAMITFGAISRLQIMRAMMKPQTRIFETPEAGLDWLLTSRTANAR